MKNLENLENIIKLDMPSFISMCKKIETLESQKEILRDENETLFETNEELIKTIRGLKERCSEYSQHIMELEAEIKDMKFAKECLGVPMTPADIAEIEFISQGEQHYADTWNINCGDDF